MDWREHYAPSSSLWKIIEIFFERKRQQVQDFSHFSLQTLLWMKSARTKESWRFTAKKLLESHVSPIVQGAPNGDKTLQTSDHHIILAERTVDDE